jgi:putative oxidoreductase
MTLLKSGSLIARLLLGLIYFVFGLNFFLHFIPNQGKPSEGAAHFWGALFQTGYLFQLIKTIEILSGALLLAGRYNPLVLVVLMPISINIFLFHSLLEPTSAGIIISSLIMVLHLFLVWRYRSQYKQLIVARPVL